MPCNIIDVDPARALFRFFLIGYMLCCLFILTKILKYKVVDRRCVDFLKINAVASFYKLNQTLKNFNLCPPS